MLDNIDIKVKLKIMYFYTMVSTILFGIVVIALPGLFYTFTDMPVQDPIMFGVLGSIWIAFGISSFLALRAPMKFIPVLFMQFTYKVIWIVAVCLPQVIMGNGGIYAIVFLVVFLTYVIPDLLFIPWKELLEKE